MSPRSAPHDEPGANPQPQRKYAVFISYRHADNKDLGRKWANWLHEALESYEVPPDLIGTTSQRGDPVPASLYPVFRDEAELPADADLTTNIRHALENSGLLVVLCSPRAVQSRFVADEIRYFKELGHSHRILALIIDGEPNASDDPAKRELLGPEAECFPEPLRLGVAAEDDLKHIDWTARTEPIAADVRPEGLPEQGWTTAAAYQEQLEKAGLLSAKQIKDAVRWYVERLELAKLKIVAGALGLPLGVLTQRDKAQQLAKARRRAKVLRRWLVAVGILSLTAVAGGIVAMQQAERAGVAADAAMIAQAQAETANLRTGEALAQAKLKTQEAVNQKASAEAALLKTRQALAKVWEEKSSDESQPASIACLTASLRYHLTDTAFKKLCFQVANSNQLIPVGTATHIPDVKTSLWDSVLTEPNTYTMTSKSGKWKAVSTVSPGNSGNAPPRYSQPLEVFELGRSEPLVIMRQNDEGKMEELVLNGLFAWDETETFLCILDGNRLHLIDLVKREVVAELVFESIRDKDEPVRIVFHPNNLITVTWRSTDASTKEVLLVSIAANLQASASSEILLQKHDFRISADDAVWDHDEDKWQIRRDETWFNCRIYSRAGFLWRLTQSTKRHFLSLCDMIEPISEMSGSKWIKDNVDDERGSRVSHVIGNSLIADLNEQTGLVFIREKLAGKSHLTFALEQYLGMAMSVIEYGAIMQNDSLLLVAGRSLGADADNYWIVQTQNGQLLYPILPDQDYIAIDRSFVVSVDDNRWWKADFDEPALTFKDLVERTLSQKLLENELPILGVTITPLGLSLDKGESLPLSFLDALENMVGLKAELDRSELLLKPISGTTVSDPFAENSFPRFSKWIESLSMPEIIHSIQKTYRVKLGDTIFSIARRHDVPIAELQKANPLTNPSKLRVGDQLIIPGGSIHKNEK